MIHDSSGLFTDFDLWGYMSVMVVLILMVVLAVLLIGVWEELIERVAMMTHSIGKKMEYGRQKKSDFQCKLDRGGPGRQESDYQVKLPRNLSEKDKENLMCECIPGTICSLKVEHWLQSKCSGDSAFPNKVGKFDGTLESTSLNKGKAYEIHKKLGGE